MTRVAFGTECFDVLNELDRIRGGKNGKGGEDIDVYIYASHVGGHDNVVTWKARYTGYVEGVGGRHPNPNLRPPSTVTDTGASLFWEVDDLSEIDAGGKYIGKLQGHNKPKPYGKSFPPRHPIIIKHPHWYIVISSVCPPQKPPLRFTNSRSHFWVLSHQFGGVCRCRVLSHCLACTMPSRS